MVHFSTTILVFAALITTGFAVPARRDASQVQNDISNIGQTVEKLNTIIANILNDITLGLTGGLDIRAAVNSLEDATNVATNDLKNTSPLSEGDADGLIQVLQPVAQDIVDTLTQLIGTKQLFDDSEVDAAILQALQELQSDTSGFQDALNAIIPDDLQQTVDGINGEINDALESVLETYGDDNN
ncbi:hypothetical protein PILCRDRAFT_7716 [Piloderma croceum F 1598]|uniref:Uncharacterized protein n=1 Tax=Piloderma croceum (strain F 1598) TaxID=765440 RepID=A0A0C3FEG4_PILCF|nr:hypothetical protein PILCRDRAFT_7716 [Piloderma croceum F 1598]